MPTSTFDEFWSLYPRKVEKKGAEAKYWTARKDVAHETIMAGLQRYVDHIKAKGIEQQFVKHPKTWLNNGCWDDDLDTAPVVTEHTIRRKPQYLMGPVDNRPKETPEEKARKRLRLEVHDVMRARKLDPFLLRAEDEAKYNAIFTEIAAKLEGAHQ